MEHSDQESSCTKCNSNMGEEVAVVAVVLVEVVVFVMAMLVVVVVVVRECVKKPEGEVGRVLWKRAEESKID